jgi:hypothetical protein
MKYFPKTLLSFLVLGFLLTLASMASSAQDSSATRPPDNTKVNDRDRDKAEPTADQQKENRSDRISLVIFADPSWRTSHSPHMHTTSKLFRRTEW